jgi:hypothetical protein
LFDEETIQKISDKSSSSAEKIRSILKEVEKINLSTSISEDDLLNINYQIEKFYERTK